MFKLQLKNWFFVLSLLTVMLASPIALTCAFSCAAHQRTAKIVEDCCEHVQENHCPPESSAVDQGLHNHAQTAVVSKAVAATQNDCCCLKNTTQQSVLTKQKIQPAQHFNPVTVPQQIKFSRICRATAIAFFKPNVVYPARSSLSNLPARAPPIL